MAYAIQPGEPLAAAVPRIAGEQLDRIAAHLAAGEIHDARKRLKELRALVRLVRGPLGDAFDDANRWARDTALQLSSARDAEAVVQVLERLRERTTDSDLKKRITAERGRLARRRAPAARTDALLAQLPDVRECVAAWPTLDERFSTIGDGAERTLRDGRRALERALDDRSPERFHDLRKRVKDHWYHLQLLRHVWPEVMEGASSAVAQLSRALGEANDLALAEPLLRDAHVREAVAARRAELERDAVAMATRLFSEKPGAWRKRLRGYWRALTSRSTHPQPASS